ncbi:MAG: hypothetical protein FJX75_15220 [Armatimonadetes bacterium]|nr:hypothetical protein [Armatimonadota bacterium]
MRPCLLMTALAIACSVAALAATTPVAELTLDSATLVRNGEPAELAPSPDRFGPGLDSVDLIGTPLFRTELRFPCDGVAGGDYHVGFLAMRQQWDGYVGFGEHLANWLQVYLNDTRLIITTHTEPQRPEDAAEKNLYQAELRCEGPVHVKPGDVLRLVYIQDGGSATVGPVRLYDGPPEGGIVRVDRPEYGPRPSVWLIGKWEDTERVGDVIRQRCLLHNPGALPHTVTLKVLAQDYLMRTLLSTQEEMTIGPGEKITPAFEFKPGDTRRARLTVTATAEGFSPPFRLVRFYLNDATQGPRPTARLEGEWEMCFVPGAEPGEAPPADAAWTKTNVPAFQSTDKTHCLWYRKTFTAPAHLKGERVILRCGVLLSEGWFTLNGKSVGHVLHGSLPFEVDLTPAFKPGESNELLVAVRDWLAYSPKNRERVARGEAPIFKDNMIDVAGYPGAASLGIGGTVTLEGRPAVSVDDVSVATSVRKHTLTLNYRLINTSPTDQTVTLTPQVLDAGEVAKALPKTQAKVPAGASTTVEVTVPWADAKLWWPEDPHLYVLQTDLQPTTGVADRHLQRFGFRELWIDGVDFVLNGTPIKIRSQWASSASGIWQAFERWEPDKRLETIWDCQTRAVQDAATQLTRTHNVNGVQETCEIADETGLMLKIEEADTAQVNFTFDQAYWNAALKHEVGMVEAYRNHASVMMWSAGNEDNLWNWIYQGEAATTLGHRWQMKICHAMRAADPMARPIEWESDGDLDGEWEHHAFHYPRELSQFPDVPNGAWWGPLDGKTVVPYHAYPVTLGQKPLTVGEAFEPGVLNYPCGQSVLLGDDTYLGGQYWWRGWIEAARFFINGFRDAEFALVDTYTPLAMQKPQTVVLKQEVRGFFGGRRLSRDLNVHNDIRRSAEFTLRWSLKPTPAAGEQKLKLAPAELKRVSLDIALPAVKQATNATLRTELIEKGVPVDVQTQDWRIEPSPSVRVPAGLQLSVFDPGGQTAAMLTALKVPFTPLSQLAAPAAGALIVGRDALKPPPEGPWREALTGFVRSGGKVLILEQSETPDFLPTPLTQAQGRGATLACIRATDHPILAGLTDADLRYWAADPSHPEREHYVSFGNYRKPIRGNYLPLADAGTMDGPVETPLLEEYEGQGSFILCQLLVTEKALAAPPACALLQNLLDYLASPTCYRSLGATAVFAQPDSPLRKALDDSRLVYEDLTGKPADLTVDRFQAAIVDLAPGLDEPTAAALRAFATAGGRVLLHRATPAQQAQLEALLGLRLRFFSVPDEPWDIRYHVFRRGNAGLMAGISNHEFFWPDNALLADIRHNGGWWSGYDCKPETFIADYFCSPGDDVLDRAVRLTRPGGLLQVPAGEGYFLLNQLRWDQPVADAAVTASRFRNLLLTNLGCTIRSEGGAIAARQRRLRQYEFFTVDLSPYANRGLADDAAAGIVGWTNQGENDMRALPTGRQTFAGIPFFIASPKAAIVLHSVSANNLELPKEVTGIKIGRKADVLFLLHTMAWSADKPFKYRVNYDDGSSVDIEIVNGQQVVDWWSDPVRFADAMSRHGLFVAWQGDNPMHQGVILPGYEWTNPHPDKVIRDLDFLTVPESGYYPVPVLAAITGAVSRPTEGVVTDVIGTQGVKVKLGTQEEEVYYIGVAGLPADHPYYAQALEAHRAMVVGQTVTLISDVVTQDAAGRRLAYVYVGRDPSNASQFVNAKIIGGGLSKLGNFEGNSRERVYLENVGFIASQKKVGLWSVGG